MIAGPGYPRLDGSVPTKNSAGVRRGERRLPYRFSPHAAVQRTRPSIRSTICCWLSVRSPRQIMREEAIPTVPPRPRSTRTTAPDFFCQRSTMPTQPRLDPGWQSFLTVSAREPRAEHEGRERVSRQDPSTSTRRPSTAELYATTRSKRSWGEEAAIFVTAFRMERRRRTSPDLRASGAASPRRGVSRRTMPISGVVGVAGQVPSGGTGDAGRGSDLSGEVPVPVRVAVRAGSASVRRRSTASSATLTSPAAVRSRRPARRCRRCSRRNR